MNTHEHVTKDAIRTELESTRTSFHALLDSFSETDWRKQSLNPGWTNGEILVHMTFGFIILNSLLPLARLWGRFPKWTSKPFAWLLNAFTGPFNWINALGARLQARVFTFGRIGKLYDVIHSSLLKQIDSIEDEEWERGMYYPTRWDFNFHEFMTIKELFHYPVVHFHFHLRQIAR
jgi:DinB superfamily